MALDVVAYDRMSAGDNAAPDEIPRGLERWTVDPALRTVDQRTIDPTPQEHPMIGNRRTGLPYRYVYALGLPAEATDTLVGPSPLLKHDVDTGGRQVHDFGPGGIPGEFVCCGLSTAIGNPQEANARLSEWSNRLWSRQRLG